MRWLVGGWCFLVACNLAEDADDGKTGDSGDSVAEGTGDSYGDDTGSGGVDRSATLTATVTDGAGAAVPDAEIRFCRALVCRTGTTDQRGEVFFDRVEVDWHAFEVRPPASRASLAIGYVPLEFESEEARVTTMVLPQLDPATPLPASSPTEIEAGEGLHVTVAADDLEPPLFEDEATEIAGVLVDPATYPPVDLDREVVRMWYMKPFDHEAAKGLPVRFENLWGAEDDTTYEVWVGSYLDQRWLPAGTVTVAGDWISGDAELDLISTVILVEAPE